METQIKGITAVIPAYSGIDVVNNSVLALVQQFVPDDTFELQIIVVNDNPKKGCQYDWYLSEDFKKIMKKNIIIDVITHRFNSGQGVARNTGIECAKYDFIVLCDEDDIYAPNAIYRYWDILQKEHNKGEENKPVSIITSPIYSFDENGYEHIIEPWSIWVNAKVYNREFLKKYNIWFPTDENSHRAEDYPFSRMVDYASRHDKDYKRIDINQESQTFYWWYPNKNSRSRCDKFYGSLLAGYTMRSSNRIFDFIENFNNKYIKEEKDYWMEDEGLKQEILNMTIYSFYNFLWFLKDLASDWNDCKEEYWIILRDSLNGLRKKLLTYWAEIVPSDVSDMIYRVKHQSDVRFIESWIGSFEYYVEHGNWLLDKDFETVKKYCKTLKFDEANHETNASYVKAWIKRRRKLEKEVSLNNDKNNEKNII